MDKFGTNTLVVYYTRTGRCQKIAEYLREILGADIEHLEDTHDYTGRKGLALCSLKAILRRNTEIKATKYDPAFYDDVILVSPIWAGRTCPAIRTYVGMHADKLPRVSLITCAGLSTKKGCEREFREDFRVPLKNAMTITVDNVDCDIYTAYVRRFANVTEPANPIKENEMNNNNQNQNNAKSSAQNAKSASNTTNEAKSAARNCSGKQNSNTSAKAESAKQNSNTSAKAESAKQNSNTSAKAESAKQSVKTSSRSNTAEKAQSGNANGKTAAKNSK